jgi:hypothetical protein
MGFEIYQVPSRKDRIKPDRQLLAKRFRGLALGLIQLQARIYNNRWGIERQ